MSRWIVLTVVARTWLDAPQEYLTPSHGWDPDPDFAQRFSDDEEAAQYLYDNDIEVSNGDTLLLLRVAFRA